MGPRLYFAIAAVCLVALLCFGAHSPEEAPVTTSPTAVLLETSSKESSLRAPIVHSSASHRRPHNGTTVHYLTNPLYQKTKLSSYGVTFVSKNGCKLANAPNYEPRLNLAGFPMIDIEPQFDCVVATAFFGSLEKTIKPVLHSNNSRCAHLCFLGNASMLNSSRADSGWRIIQTPYHLSDPRNPQDGSGHSFQSAKWYKMNTYKLLPKTVRFYFWMDGDTQIVNASAADATIKLLEERASVVTLKHFPSESATAEALASEGKYVRLATYHYLASFFLTHLIDGYCEHGTIDSPTPAGSRLSCIIQSAWNCQCPQPKKYPPASYIKQNESHRICNEKLVVRRAQVSARHFVFTNRNRCVHYHSDMRSEVDPARIAGMFYTKIIGFDLAVDDTKRFLDYWYAITYHHWQDQFSVAIAAWRFGVTLSVMPFPSEWVSILGHGH
jgi:hypothetical protein